jgi:hypothetical protein
VGRKKGRFGENTEKKKAWNRAVKTKNARFDRNGNKKLKKLLKILTFVLDEGLSLSTDRG